MSNLNIMSSHSCLVSFCQTKGTPPGISYFKLTKNRYNSWLQALGIDPSVQKFSRHNRICSVHFALEDMLVSPRGKTLLKSGAVPRFNLGPNVEIRKSLIEERNLHTVRFPTDNVKRNIWLSLLGWGEERQLPKYSHICSSHFDNSDVATKANGSKYLKPDATPLPCYALSLTYSSDSEVYDNPPKKTKYEEIKFNSLIRHSPSSSERKSTGQFHDNIHQKTVPDIEYVRLKEELREGEIAIKSEDENGLLDLKASTGEVQKTVPHIDSVYIKEELQEYEITVKSEDENYLSGFKESTGEVHDQTHQKTVSEIDIVRIKEELQEEEITIKPEDENDLLNLKESRGEVHDEMHPKTVLGIDNVRIKEEEITIKSEDENDVFNSSLDRTIQNRISRCDS